MSKWREFKVGNIAKIENGFAFKSKDFSIDGVPIIKIKNVKPNLVNTNDLSYVSFELASKLSKYKINKGDILITMSGNRIDGSPDSWVGKVATFNLKGTFLLNQRVSKIIVSSNDINPIYLSYVLSSNEYQQYFINEANSSGGQANISPEIVRNTTFNAPDFPTQTTIAEILSSLDDKIELNNKINQELENLAQTLFKQWFIDFDFPNENGEPYKSSGGEMVESELGEIPKGWEVGTLKDEFGINMGQSPKGDTYNETGDGMIFFQGRSDFGFRFPSVRMFTNDPKKVSKKFETLISVRAPVGDINMAENDCCIGRGLGSISNPRKLFSYTYYKIQSIQEELKSYDNEGTVFGSINKETLGNIKTIIPPFSTSNDFDELVKEKDSLIYNFTNQNKQLSNLRDTLLPKLISGELEVSQIQTNP